MLNSSESFKKLAVIEKLKNILEKTILPLTYLKVLNLKKRSRSIGSKIYTARNTFEFERKIFNKTYKTLIND